MFIGMKQRRMKGKNELGIRNYELGIISRPIHQFLFNYSFYILLFLFIANISFAQDTPIAFNKSYFNSYFTDTKDMIIAPFHWNGRQFEAATSFVLVAATLSLEDIKIKNFFKRNRTTLTNNISKYVAEPWGSGIYSMAAMGLFYLEGAIFKDDRSKKVAMLGTKALVLSAGAVLIPKFLVQRHRPYQDESNQYLFQGPITFNKYTSFTSGHATSAFAIATVVASEYKEKPLVVIIAYTIATLCGLSRLNDNEHWASDVLCGAAFGYAMGKLIYNKNNWGVKQFKAP